MNLPAVAEYSAGPAIPCHYRVQRLKFLLVLNQLNPDVLG
jgi:hypothetical protein